MNAGTEHNFIIYGRNPVLEALDSGAEIDKILIQRNIEGAGKRVFAMAKKAKIPVQTVDKFVLDKTAGGSGHQGVLAYLSEYSYATVDEIFALAERRGEAPLLVLLDGIEDPQNLGAIIRSAECAGAHGVIIPNRRSASVTGTVIKVSAGAALNIPVARVSNIVMLTELLKKRGVWIYGLDMDGQAYTAVDFSGGTAIIVGAEGAGLSKLVREKCDFVISIPMRGKTASLNASNAATVVLFAASDRLGGEL